MISESRMVRKKVRPYGEIFLPSDNLVDQSVASEILEGTTYPKVAGQADLIWDVGANVGMAALYFARTYPNAEIHCFEPSQDLVWECLKENTCRIQSRTSLHPYGLANTEEERPMNEWKGATVTRSCRHQLSELVEETLACRFKVPSTPDGVTIMKIDTEGCEVEILETLGGSRHRVPLYYIEYHSESDRRKIDELLPDHSVVRSSAALKHRGNVCYLHDSITTSEDKWEIT